MHTELHIIYAYITDATFDRLYLMVQIHIITRTYPYLVCNYITYP